VTINTNSASANHGFDVLCGARSAKCVIMKVQANGVVRCVLAVHDTDVDTSAHEPDQRHTSLLPTGFDEEFSPGWPDAI
jgi:hypothetical protein